MIKFDDPEEQLLANNYYKGSHVGYYLDRAANLGYEELFKHLVRQHVAVCKDNSCYCECGSKRSVSLMFKCLYCGAFFCQSCAEIHFGMTRKEYNKTNEIHSP